VAVRRTVVVDPPEARRTKAFSEARAVAAAARVDRPAALEEHKLEARRVRRAAVKVAAVPTVQWAAARPAVPPEQWAVVKRAVLLELWAVARLAVPQEQWVADKPVARQVRPGKRVVLRAVVRKRVVTRAEWVVRKLAVLQVAWAVRRLVAVQTRARAVKQVAANKAVALTADRWDRLAAVRAAAAVAMQAEVQRAAAVAPGR
jgi:hypothetical protein